MFFILDTLKYIWEYLHTPLPRWGAVLLVGAASFLSFKLGSSLSMEPAPAPTVESTASTASQSDTEIKVSCVPAKSGHKKSATASVPVIEVKTKSNVISSSTSVTSVPKVSALPASTSPNYRLNVGYTTDRKVEVSLHRRLYGPLHMGLGYNQRGEISLTAGVEF